MTEARRTSIFVSDRQKKLAVDVSQIQEFASRALVECLLHTGTEPAVLPELQQVDVVLVSDFKIADLHKRFMNIEGPTDVITFDHGEIVISVETAVREAPGYGNSAEREIKLYVVHGLLHLNGHDDKTPDGAQRMRELQEQILDKCSPATRRSSPAP